ncbi:MAG: hypothetical protein ACXWB9_06225 [Flavisolibacter sp.]
MKGLIEMGLAFQANTQMSQRGLCRIKKIKYLNAGNALQQNLEYNKAGLSCGGMNCHVFHIWNTEFK